MPSDRTIVVIDQDGRPINICGTPFSFHCAPGGIDGLTVHFANSPESYFTPVRLAVPCEGGKEHTLTVQEQDGKSFVVIQTAGRRERPILIPVIDRFLGDLEITFGSESRSYPDAEAERKAVCLITTDGCRRTMALGFVIDPKGIVMTCGHVVLGVQDISVYVGGSTTSAQLVAWHCDDIRGIDMALLRLEPGSYTSLPLANSQTELKENDEVRLYFFPDRHSPRKIPPSSRTARICAPPEMPQKAMFRIDANLRPGESGAPILDRNNHIIGMVGGAFPRDNEIEIAAYSIQPLWTSFAACLHQNADFGEGL